MSDEIRSLAILYANRIGSPWGEGATYDHEQAKTRGNNEPKPNGKLYSHLDDEDFELFVRDFQEDVSNLIDQALTAYKKELLSKAEKHYWHNKTWHRYEQGENCVPVSAIQEDEEKDAQS